ncbi:MULTISPECIES: type I-B CRISPR-associated protein Cas5b [unclassified Thermosipho (in: thermotogales)]|uniref:type I-B CRISPR-associated protein Cas5b n=1 Tax=unclassified Thermosipho (in: thermotogales) TaxID=2676525 RepID=UPI00098586E0|nr:MULTISPECIES: type I-B CRISPR-associated protein Cas5b [unclassified Thermosipho (in: thermotogales)]MBT1248354.1 hypothetical protein [Thermosipho sp. 1244]
MKIIVFDLLGKMAHFRKFYTNSSSLSYYFPPKTVISGLIAGVLGMEKDSYYEFFDEPAKVAIEIKTSLRKQINVVNYLMIKKEDSKKISSFRGMGNRTLVPMEFVYPKDSKFLCYRIYFNHEDEKILKNFEKRLEEKKFIYPPYLGITELPAKLEFIGSFKGEINNESEVVVPTVLKREYYKRLELMGSLQRDRLPESFYKDRRIKKVSDYVYIPYPDKIKFLRSSSAQLCNISERGITISFL